MKRVCQVAERQERAFSVVETAGQTHPSEPEGLGRTRGFERLVKKTNLRQKHTETRGIETAPQDTQKREISNKGETDTYRHTDNQERTGTQKNTARKRAVVLWGRVGVKEGKEAQKLSRQPERAGETQIKKHRSLKAWRE